MLLSGAGLLAFALVDLWGAVRDVDEVARKEARRNAASIAAELQSWLASDSILETVQSAAKFRLRDGELVIPDAIGWLESPPVPYSEADLPTEAWSRLRAARRLEFVVDDRAGAARELAEALAVGGLHESAHNYLAIESSWQFVRFGNVDAAWRMVSALLKSAHEDAGIAASTVLLARRLGESVPDAIEARCLTLSVKDRDALFDSVEWRKRCDVIDARRALLNFVGAQLPTLRHGVLLPDDRLVILQERGGVVAGAVMSPTVLTDWNEQVRVHSAPATADAVSVTPSVSVEPVVADVAIWTNPIVLIVLLVVLAICFGVGLLFSFRAILRESAAMRARADFLTSVTHELKTPLSSIRLLSEMLEEGRVGGEAKKTEYYGLLAGESARLTVLIENVLDLGRMERGERAYDLRPHNIDAVVAEATKVFEPIAARDGLQLEVHLEAGEREARIDRGALVQALLNVMDNARKYAVSGGRLEVRSHGENGTWWLSVRDHGPGIDAVEREAIFKQFARGQGQKDGSVAGVGLGLYLARTILRAHDGELSCVAPQGEGAEFVFSIPLDPPLPEQES